MPANVKLNLALKKRLDSFSTALAKSDGFKLATGFLAPNVDFRGSGGVLRGPAAISAVTAEMKLRAKAEQVSMKWITPDFALVDGNFEAGAGKGWYTEIWQKDGTSHQLVASRLRVGASNTSFEALSQISSQVVAEAMTTAASTKERANLQQQFTTFRTAFNKGDKKTVMSLCTNTCDAIPVFGFLNGRAQILSGQMAVGGKADRMMNLASDPAPDRAAVRATTTFAARGTGALFIGGEAKVVRFLAADVAVIDGTAEISNIPSAHEFSPRDMKGVYSNVWVKSGAQWRCEGARAWF